MGSKLDVECSNFYLLKQICWDEACLDSHACTNVHLPVYLNVFTVYSYAYAYRATMHVLPKPPIVRFSAFVYHKFNSVATIYRSH